MTLLNYENPGTELEADYPFANLFKNCSNLTSAPALPATSLASYCYAYMFEECTGLTSKAKSLPEAKDNAISGYTPKTDMAGKQR